MLCRESRCVLRVDPEKRRLAGELRKRFPPDPNATPANPFTYTSTGIGGSGGLAIKVRVGLDLPVHDQGATDVTAGEEPGHG